MEPCVVQPTAIDDVLPVVTSVENANKEAIDQLTSNKGESEE